MTCKSITMFTLYGPPSVNPDLSDRGLLVHFKVYMIMASKCISKFTHLWPQSTFLSSLSKSIFHFAHLASPGTFPIILKDQF